MTTTLVQSLQHTLSNSELRAVLFAVQMEAQRYKDLPYEDLPIEVATLLRSRSYLANFVHGIGAEHQTLLTHEWEIFLVAMKLELQRYDCILEELKPKFVEDLRAAVHWVQGAILVDRKNIQEAGKK